eukprot:CAMPEP_0206536394 /NCGR_PEP_ID=MMETSP0325_2-20121206/6721_1 /ASSEMBLY_ACC=CAM_ASM_000347 /TAXON_ID=2866 /ORGANISM="Crypthecodinium cohnii, Strain Seligo" /LENGTH=459 /DNA_ID=CAMNT_0054033593 /DNA_START=153 /DNA_END=1529 /DNA_ORIENTATION=+
MATFPQEGDFVEVLAGDKSGQIGRVVRVIGESAADRRWRVEFAEGRPSWASSVRAAEPPTKQLHFAPLELSSAPSSPTASGSGSPNFAMQRSFTKEFPAEGDIVEITQAGHSNFGQQGLVVKVRGTSPTDRHYRVELSDGKCVWADSVLLKVTAPLNFDGTRGPPTLVEDPSGVSVNDTVDEKLMKTLIDSSLAESPPTSLSGAGNVGGGKGGGAIYMNGYGGSHSQGLEQSASSSLAAAAAAAAPATSATTYPVPYTNGVGGGLHAMNGASSGELTSDADRSSLATKEPPEAPPNDESPTSLSGGSNPANDDAAPTSASLQKAPSSGPASPLRSSLKPESRIAPLPEGIKSQEVPAGGTATTSSSGRTSESGQRKSVLFATLEGLKEPGVPDSKTEEAPPQPKNPQQQQRPGNTSTTSQWGFASEATNSAPPTRTGGSSLPASAWEETWDHVMRLCCG